MRRLTFQAVSRLSTEEQSRKCESRSFTSDPFVMLMNRIGVAPEKSIKLVVNSFVSDSCVREIPLISRSDPN